MPEDVCCVAHKDDETREIAENKATGVAPDVSNVIAKPAEIESLTHGVSEEARNASKGAVVGKIIGLLFGAAMLSTIGFEGIPGLFEAILMLACAAFGGAMFGAIVGSTGLFAAKRISDSPENHFEEEIRSRSKSRTSPNATA